MPFCNKCGTEIPENTNFCPKCGGQQGGGNAAATGMMAKINKRMVLAIASAIGILAVFMPWVNHPLKNFNGLNIQGLENIGVATLIFFAFPIITFLLKDKILFNLPKSMVIKIVLICWIIPSLLLRTEKGRYVGSGLCGLLNLFLVYGVQNDIKLGQLTSWGMGYYLTILAGIVVTVTSILIIRDMKSTAGKG